MPLRCFAAEIWDAKGLASLPWDYDNAALQLNLGSCEDDGPSRIHSPRGSAIVHQGRDAALSEA